MIYSKTKLFVVDNCGAKLVKCISVLKSSKRKGGRPGQIVIGNVRKVTSGKRFVKGDLIRGVLIRCKKDLLRLDGTSVSFSDNAIISINEKGLPLGTRLFGPVYKELKNHYYSKLVSLAKVII